MISQATKSRNTHSAVFGEYHVPVHADIEDIEVIFIDKPDPEVTPLGLKGLGVKSLGVKSLGVKSLGVKGLGEIGIVAVAEAVANAIHHATGRRVRSPPITVDKLLAA